MVFLFGIYTDIGISVGGPSLFPMVSALPGFFLLLPIFGKKYFAPTYFFTALFPLLPLALALLGPSAPGATEKRLIAAGQLEYSLVLGMMMFWLVTSLSRERVAAILRFALPIYIALLVIEILTPLQSLMQEYLNICGQGGINYSVINRDIAIAGGYRPRFLTSETSYVAMCFTFMVGCYVWASSAATKTVTALFYTLIGTLVIRSPIVLSGLLFLTTDYSSQFIISARTRRAALWFIPTILLVGSVAIIIFIQAAAPYINARWEGIATGGDYSATYRTYGSLAAGIAVANRYPSFGLGIGTYYLALETIESVYISYGVPLTAIISDARGSLNNALAASLILFGYLGTAVMLTASGWALRKLTGRMQPQFIAMVLVLCAVDGAIYSPKFVVYLMLFAGINKVVERTLHKYKSVRDPPGIVRKSIFSPRARQRSLDRQAR
ncbi:MAG: hypothetical protein WCA78_16210 [Rhizomicrobium sp.]